MPKVDFTVQEDKAFLALILTLPAQKILGAILFLMLVGRQDRVALVTYLSS